MSDAADAPIERRLAGILSADVKGYSTLMRDDEVATVRTLTAYRGLMAEIIRGRRGRVVDSPGDNLLAEFSSVIDAVEAGVEIQAGLRKRNAELPEGRRMQFRIGVNLGEILVDGGRIYGDGVNMAARLEGLTDPGGIVISASVWDQIRDRMRVAVESLGERRVKNVAEPVNAYPIVADPAGRETATPSSLSASETGLALPDRPSIAVLPFANLSGGPEQEYLADGITEELITSLARLR